MHKASLHKHSYAVEPFEDLIPIYPILPLNTNALIIVKLHYPP